VRVALPNRLLLTNAGSVGSERGALALLSMKDRERPAFAFVWSVRSRNEALDLQTTLAVHSRNDQFPDMTPSVLLDEILRLPADQRLKLVEDIWDSLAASPTTVPVPPWHRDELDRRLANPSEQATLTWDDVRARLKPK
jgi:putative addiction module component (TIGR02574 family)